MVSPFAEQPRSMHRYKNDFRWRIMPPEQAEAQGYFTRGFGNKAKAHGYRALVANIAAQADDNAGQARMSQAVWIHGFAYGAIVHHHDKGRRTEVIGKFHEQLCRCLPVFINGRDNHKGNFAHRLRFHWTLWLGCHELLHCRDRKPSSGHDGKA